MDYIKLVDLLKKACNKIKINFYSEVKDGRLVSAIKEKEYLNELGKNLKVDTNIILEYSKDRNWFDFKANNIPFNLKITSGGTDNAFNKNAIIYTLSGNEKFKSNMNFNDFLKELQQLNKKKRENHLEYHYLAVDKSTGKFIIKSILDIYEYKSNPCNILQINWKKEFENSDHKINDDDYEKKIKELLLTIQTSVKKDVENKKKFVDFNFDSMIFLKR
jgi:hypothetical protein